MTIQPSAGLTEDESRRPASRGRVVDKSCTHDFPRSVCGNTNISNQASNH